jgi:hypothetical protein
MACVSVAQPSQDLAGWVRGLRAKPARRGSTRWRSAFLDGIRFDAAMDGPILGARCRF